jgi:hypothetical protein
MNKFLLSLSLFSFFATSAYPQNYFNGENLKLPFQVVFDKDEQRIEDTVEWKELSIQKNTTEYILLQNFGCVISTINDDECLIHNKHLQKNILDLIEERKSIVSKMNDIKSIFECKIDYNSFPFIDIFEKNLFDVKIQFANIQSLIRNKITSLEQQNKNFYYIAVNLSESKRFEEALITLKKITKDYSQYAKVTKYISFNKQKLSNQIAYENRMNRGASARNNFARKLEHHFLDNGMDTTVTANGEYNQSLYINYIFAGRVFANTFRKSEMCQLVKRLGFTEIVFDSDYSDDIWTITLK